MSVGDISGRLVATEGVITSSLPNGGYMDAALSGDLFGVEFGLNENAVIDLGADASYRPDLALSLSMNKGTANKLLHLLAEKLGLPAFNKEEWLRIAWALDRLDRIGQVDEHDDLMALAARITEAYR